MEFSTCKYNLVYLYLSIVDSLYEVDKHIMYLILTRIFIGNDIAKIKFKKDKHLYLKAKHEKDIMNLLTNELVEKKILDDIKKKPGKSKIIQQMYNIMSKILIPYTKIIEVKYIQQMIKHEKNKELSRPMQRIK